jgi:hypothetical protein
LFRVGLNFTPAYNPLMPPGALRMGDHIVCNPDTLQFPGDVEHTAPKFDMGNGDGFIQMGKLTNPVTVTFTHTNTVRIFPVDSVVDIFWNADNSPKEINLVPDAHGHAVIAALPPQPQPMNGGNRRRSSRRRHSHRRNTRKSRNSRNSRRHRSRRSRKQ